MKTSNNRTTLFALTMLAALIGAGCTGMDIISSTSTAPKAAAPVQGQASQPAGPTSIDPSTIDAPATSQSGRKGG